MDAASLFSVKGKVALVTGGGKGIGRMIATALALNGARVYVCGRKESDLVTTASEINALCKTQTPGQETTPSPTPTPESGGGQVIPLQCDLQSLPACQTLAATLASKESKLHILVNNSGASWGEALDTYPDHAWGKLLTLNLHRVFTLVQLLLPLLKSAGKDGGRMDPGRIVNIGSIDALRVPMMENYAYSASKAGLHHLSRTLAVRLGPEGVTSNVLACGPFETKMMKATLESFREAIEGANPLGRIGTPEDVGGAVVWLCSRAGAYVNGATISLDGGAHLMAKM